MSSLHLLWVRDAPWPASVCALLPVTAASSLHPRGVSSPSPPHSQAYDQVTGFLTLQLHRLQLQTLAPPLSFHLREPRRTSWSRHAAVDFPIQTCCRKRCCPSSLSLPSCVPRFLLAPSPPATLRSSFVGVVSGGQQLSVNTGVRPRVCIPLEVTPEGTFLRLPRRLSVLIPPHSTCVRAHTHFLLGLVPFVLPLPTFREARPGQTWRLSAPQWLSHRPGGRRQTLYWADWPVSLPGAASFFSLLCLVQSLFQKTLKCCM